MNELTSPPFDLAVTLIGFCDITECRQQFTPFADVVPAGLCLPIIAPPPGWNVLNGKLLCPKHKVTIFNVVDGLPVVLKGIGI